MKKPLSIALAFIFAVAMLAGCNSSTPAASDAPAVSGVPAASETPAAVDSAAPAVVSGDATPSASFTRYSTMKSNALTRITDMTGTNDELALYSLTLLPITMVDLTLIPLSLLTGETAYTDDALAMLGVQGLKIDNTNGGYTITYTDSEGKKLVQTCLYDAATDSIQSSITDESGKETMFFEYVKAGNGYAAQYYTVDESGTTVITGFFDEFNISAFGLKSANQKPASIFKNAGVTVDIVKSGDTYMILQDGKLTVHDNGTDKTY